MNEQELVDGYIPINKQVKISKNLWKYLIYVMLGLVGLVILLSIVK